MCVVGFVYKKMHAIYVDLFTALVNLLVVHNKLLLISAAHSSHSFFSIKHFCMCSCVYVLLEYYCDELYTCVLVFRFDVTSYMLLQAVVVVTVIVYDRIT